MEEEVVAGTGVFSVLVAEEAVSVFTDEGCVVVSVLLAVEEEVVFAGCVFVSVFVAVLTEVFSG